MVFKIAEAFHCQAKLDSWYSFHLTDRISKNADSYLLSEEVP
jgi:hypothetical protein